MVHLAHLIIDLVYSVESNQASRQRSWVCNGSSIMWKESRRQGDHNPVQMLRLWHQGLDYICVHGMVRDRITSMYTYV